MSVVAKTRRMFLIVACLISIVALQNTFLCKLANADKFPSREVNVIINYSPGGGTDMMSRLLGNWVSKELKVPFVFHNKTGGGGAICANYIAQAKPDGYTIGIGSGGNLGTFLATNDDAPYSLKNFSGIVRSDLSYILMVTKKGRFKSFDELLKKAKKSNTLTFASWGTNSMSHLFGEFINWQFGIKMKHVPFAGGAPAMAAALGGHVDVALVSEHTAISNIKAGTLTCLLVSGEERAKSLPNSPTLRKFGLDKKVQIPEIYEGFVTSSKVPEERVAILSRAYVKALNDPEVKKVMLKRGMIPAPLTYKEYDIYLKNMLNTLEEIAGKVGLKGKK